MKLNRSIAIELWFEGSQELFEISLNLENILKFRKYLFHFLSDFLSRSSMLGFFVRGRWFKFHGAPSDGEDQKLHFSSLQAHQIV